MNSKRFRFLYRQSEGRIDAATWRFYVLPPVGLAIVMTLVWFAIAPSGPRDMATQPFFDLASVIIYAYFLIYVFALLLCAISYYFISAKRFYDIGMPASFAGIALMALFVAGAAHWYQPRSEGAMTIASIWHVDTVAVAVAFGTAGALGFRNSVSRK